MVAHPGGMFSFSLFLAFTRNSRKILYHFSTPPLGSARLFTVIISGDENEKKC